MTFLSGQMALASSCKIPAEDATYLLLHVSDTSSFEFAVVMCHNPLTQRKGSTKGSLLDLVNQPRDLVLGSVRVVLN